MSETKHLKHVRLQGLLPCSTCYLQVEVNRASGRPQMSYCLLVWLSAYGHVAGLMIAPWEGSLIILRYPVNKLLQYGLLQLLLELEWPGMGLTSQNGHCPNAAD